MNRIPSDIPGENRAILYIPKLKEKIGDVAATILMYQLERHFIMKPDGFEKFLYPIPKLIHYKPGESWLEELGFTRKEFRTAFEKIGVWHPYISQYGSALRLGEEFGENKDQYYSLFFEQKTGLTHLLRNHKKVNALIESMVGGAE